MKGVIVDAIKDMITEKFGREAWAEVLEGAGFSRTKVFPLSQDVPDEDVLKIINVICDRFGLDLQEAADMFGEYWNTVYIHKVYKAYFRGIESAKDFLLKMDEIHRKATENIPGARPPRFEYRWKDSRTLLMKYLSRRKLMPIFIGLIKGVGKNFNTPLQVRQVSENEVEIVFPE